MNSKKISATSIVKDKDLTTVIKFSLYLVYNIYYFIVPTNTHRPKINILGFQRSKMQ